MPTTMHALMRARKERFIKRSTANKYRNGARPTLTWRNPALSKMIELDELIERYGTQARARDLVEGKRA